MNGREAFIERWKHKLLGMAVDGIIHTNPDRDARLRLLSNLPMAVTALLEAIYDDARKGDDNVSGDRSAGRPVSALSGLEGT